MDKLKQTRWVKRLEDGSYTIKSHSNIHKQKDLCDVCGIKIKCPIYEARSRLLACGASFELNSCARYVPIVTFRRPLVGLSQRYFNTLRSGTAWANRVSQDSIVCLADAGTGEPIRFMKVAFTTSGPVNEMLKKHSRLNHLCLGGETQGKVAEVIKRSYGKFLNEDSLLTAIYFRSIKPEFDQQYHTEEELNFMDDIVYENNIISLADRRR
ncbi:TPA: hypothetical protein ACJI3N_005235 [Raoultella planticola]